MIWLGRCFVTFSLVLLVACTGPASEDGEKPQGETEAPPTDTVAAIDLFGTDQITPDEIERRFGADIRRLAVGKNDPESARLGPEIEREIHAMGDFAWVNLSFTTDYSPDATIYVSIDVVDEADRDQRLSFAEEPAEALKDPAGLVAAMSEYLDVGFELLGAGEIDGGRVDCPAFHCLFGYEHPSLSAYGERFVAEVPVHRAELEALLQRSGDSDERAQAAFLLAHIADGDALVRLLVPAIRDPDGLVRNNAMRVLMDIAHHHPEIEIPLEPVLLALQFPTAKDRNKASAILAALADRPEHHDAIVRGAGPVLLEMLELQQPNNHDNAYRILEKVSGEEFGERDYAAWRDWYEARISR